jgi:hypothetical protein
MKQYEYKSLSDKPLIAMSSPQQFAEWMVKTMNRWGAEGWMLLQVSTPQVNNQLTGDLLALGCRELLPPAPKQVLPDDVTNLRG